MKSFKIVKICLMINTKFGKKIFLLKLYFATIILIQSAQHFYEKREGFSSGSASGSVLVINGSGRLKTYGFGSKTLTAMFCKQRNVLHRGGILLLCSCQLNRLTVTGTLREI